MKATMSEIPRLDLQEKNSSGFKQKHRKFSGRKKLILKILFDALKSWTPAVTFDLGQQEPNFSLWMISPRNQIPEEAQGPTGASGPVELDLAPEGTVL